MSPWPEIQIKLSDQENICTTLLRFNSGMTRGLDVSYDAGMFKANPNFSLFSRLIEDNGVDFGIQCMPEDYENLIIPIGFDAKVGDMVTFTAEATNLPETAYCYLEDRNASTVTRLDEDGSSYTVELTIENLKDDNFFIHTSPKTLEIKDPDVAYDNYKYITNRPEGYVRIIGDIKTGSKLRVYDLAGRLMTESLLYDNFNNTADFSDLNKGIYIIQFNNGKKLIREKISW
jgi:hypothetical protein